MKHNHKIGGTVPLALDDSECAIPSNGVCISTDDKAMWYLESFLASLNKQEGGSKDAKGKDDAKGKNGDRKIRSAKTLVDLVKAKLGVEHEADIWKDSRVRKFVGQDNANHILSKKYKIEGPAIGTALLDNFNIDDTLEQWSENSMKLFGKRFYHVPFQMIDFMKTGGELSSLDLSKLIKNWDCFAVVLNTDISTGPGKHWFCIYGDFTHAGTRDDPYTLEYFNSSGNAPRDSVAEWMDKATHQLLRESGKYCDIIRSIPKQIQKSRTECGMWSLLYIRSRLEGHHPRWFYEVKANDNDMINLRAKVFRPKS